MLKLNIFSVGNILLYTNLAFQKGFLLSIEIYLFNSERKLFDFYFVPGSWITFAKKNNKLGNTFNTLL